MLYYRALDHWTCYILGIAFFSSLERPSIRLFPETTKRRLLYV